MRCSIGVTFHRSPWMTGIALALGALGFSAASAAAQLINTWVPLDRAGPTASIGEGFAVTHNGERPVELVLIAYRVRDGQIVDTHRSATFEVAPDRPFPLNRRYLPRPRFYDGKVAGETVLARAPIRLASDDRDVNVWWESVREGADFTGSRVLPDWRRQDALVLIVGPADARLRNTAMAHPMLIRLEGRSR